MERKLVKQGRNALTVTLPAKWLRFRNLEAGDSVYMDERDDGILVSSRQKAHTEEVTLDARTSERSMAYHMILDAYLKGYDRIIVLHSSPQSMQDLLPSLLGMIIASHSATRTEFKNVIALPQEDFFTLLRRASFMLEEQSGLLVAAASGDAKYDDVKKQEKLLDTNLYYCMRYLNKYERREGAYRLFLLAATLEYVGDKISGIAKFIGKDIASAKLVHDTIKKYNRYFFAHDLQKLYTLLRKARNQIAKETFVEGLVYSLLEALYNNLGYMVDPRKNSSE